MFRIEKELERLRNRIIKPTKEVNEFLEEHNSSQISNGIKEIELLKRSEIKYDDLKVIDNEMPALNKMDSEEEEIKAKYEGIVSGIIISIKAKQAVATNQTSR